MKGIVLQEVSNLHFTVHERIFVNTWINKMLRNLLTQFTPIFRGNKEIKLRLVKQCKHFCTISPNETVEKWMTTLPEDKQKRVKLIQNEVPSNCLIMKRSIIVNSLNIYFQNANVHLRLH